MVTVIVAKASGLTTSLAMRLEPDLRAADIELAAIYYYNKAPITYLRKVVCECTWRTTKPNHKSSVTRRYRSIKFTQILLK